MQKQALFFDPSCRISSYLSHYKGISGPNTGKAEMTEKGDAPFMVKAGSQIELNQL